MNQEKTYSYKNIGVYILSAFSFLLLAFSNYPVQNTVTLLVVLFCLYLIYQAKNQNKILKDSLSKRIFALLFNICVGAQFIIQFVNNTSLMTVVPSMIPYKLLILVLLFVFAIGGYWFVHACVLLIPNYPYGDYCREKIHHLLKMPNLNKIIIGLFICSFIFRLIITPFTTSNDYGVVFVEWIGHYKKYGIYGLGIAMGDYYIPQNFLLYLMSIMPFHMSYNVAIFSWIGECANTYMLYKIMCVYLKKENHPRALLVSVLLLYLPMVWLNSSVWKQCDAIYTFFMLGSLYYSLKRQPTQSFIMLGLSIAFKLQGVFFIPFYVIIYYIQKRKGFYNIIFVPIMFFLAGLPAVLLGQSFRDVYLRYFDQAGMYSVLTFSYPNIYGFEFTHLSNQYYSILVKVAILITILAFLVIGLTALKYKDRFSLKNEILLAAFSNYTCCMFLPAMHERYDYVTILLLVMIVLTIDKRYSFITFMLNVVSFVTYTTYLFHSMFALPALSLVNCYIYYIYFKKLLLEEEIEVII